MGVEYYNMKKGVRNNRLKSEKAAVLGNPIRLVEFLFLTLCVPCVILQCVDEPTR